MKKITITLYSFNELSPEVQKKVLDDNRSINIDYEWYNLIYDNWKNILSSFGFINPEIFFSGFYLQGDGATFDADIDLETILKQEGTPEFKKLILAKNEVAFSIYKNGYSNYYSHEKTRYIDFVIRNVRNNTYELLCSFRDWLESKRIDLCQKIYKDLQTEYEYLTSDEAVKETIIANEYTFESNGSIRNE